MHFPICKYVYTFQSRNVWNHSLHQLWLRNLNFNWIIYFNLEDGTIPRETSHLISFNKQIKFQQQNEVNKWTFYYHPQSLCRHMVSKLSGSSSWLQSLNTKAYNSQTTNSIWTAWQVDAWDRSHGKNWRRVSIACDLLLFSYVPYVSSVSLVRKIRTQHKSWQECELLVNAGEGRYNGSNMARTNNKNNNNLLRRWR